MNARALVIRSLSASLFCFEFQKKSKPTAFENMWLTEELPTNVNNN